jgi:hypothetical protein
MTASSRALSAYEAAALGVDTKSTTALLPDSSARNRDVRALRGQPSVSETSAPAFEVTAKYLYQSYFDDTLGVQALLSQAPGSPIVQSTLATQQVTGYAVGLHPSSETPIAISFFTGGQQGGSSPYRLAPGQVIRPHGKPLETSGAFSGFQFGLPFGWLGGGSALLVVLRTPQATVNWTHYPEIIYHRMRLQIVSPATIPTSATVKPNWPHRFPWPYAVRGSNNLTQRGQPALAVTPTKTALRLRVNDMSGGAADTRCLFYGTNDFDLDLNGAIASTTTSGFMDITWGNTSPYAGSVGVGTNQYQTQFFSDSQLTRFAADEGGALVLTSTDARLQSQYVDICRYGRL